MMGGRLYSCYRFLRMLLTRVTSLLFDALLSLTHPQICSLCKLSVERRADGVVCERCWEQTRIFPPEQLVCWKCGVPATGIVPPEKWPEVRCRRCDEQVFSAARACGEYSGALRETVLALKRQPYLPHRLLEVLTVICRREPLAGSTRLVPVPLHPQRQRKRGFNQAVVIASALSKSLQLPVDEVSLVRTVQSEQYRAGLDAKGREETVVRAFVVSYPQLIKDENILLVDDVFTTGATSSACARALLEAGAANVFVVTLARPAR